MKALRKLSHPNIVTYYTTFVDKNFMCIEMEFCDRGDLGSWIDERQPHWTPVGEQLLFEWVEVGEGNSNTFIHLPRCSVVEWHMFIQRICSTET